MCSRSSLLLSLLLLPLAAAAQTAEQRADSTTALVFAQSVDPESLGLVSSIQNPSSDRAQEALRPRNDAMLNGALIALGALGIFDNVVIHWILELHRAVPGEHALAVEIGIVAVSAAMLGYGIWRERQARGRFAGRQ
jgi:hypothetical protein